MGEGEPREEARGAGGRGKGGGGWGERSTLRAGRAGGGREDTQEAGAGASASAREANGRGEVEDGLWREEAPEEPPNSPSRPKRETPKTAADWLTMAQVVGARETAASLPPLQRFLPPSSLRQRPLFRAHAHKNRCR